MQRRKHMSILSQETTRRVTTRILSAVPLYAVPQPGVHSANVRSANTPTSTIDHSAIVRSATTWCSQCQCTQCQDVNHLNNCPQCHCTQCHNLVFTVPMYAVPIGGSVRDTTTTAQMRQELSRSTLRMERFDNRQQLCKCTRSEPFYDQAPSPRFGGSSFLSPRFGGSISMTNN
jgi:hypothetical protein